MKVAANGYQFVPEVAPREQDILLPKKHPSAFFGTPLVSYLVDLGVDSLVEKPAAPPVAVYAAALSMALPTISVARCPLSASTIEAPPATL